MQDSLGGGESRTLIFVNTSPVLRNLQETIDTLRYGQFLKDMETYTAASAEMANLTKLVGVLQSKLSKYESVDALLGDKAAAAAAGEEKKD